MKRLLFSILALWLCHLPGKAQQDPMPVEIFCGAELGYADNNWLRLFDVLIDLTPGIKWNMGNDWQVAAQLSLPIVCEGWTFEDPRYHMMRLSTAAVSKQLHFDEARQHFKFSAGLFGNDRYGFDVKWMMPVNDWLLVQAQAGLTSYWIMGGKFDGEGDTRFESKLTPTFMAGANVFLKSLNTELRGSGGRFINKDYGLQADVVSHFRYCSVNLFYQLRVGKRISSLVDDYSDRSNGGFNVIVMLPPYKKSQRVISGNVEFRPASNFRLTNNVRSDGRSMIRYNTDPEENERELPVDVKWGISANSLTE